jgi:predicted polyphosphate/ATP-dependent NAD kinase
MTHIGFVINPIAGMGGRVGLKGTDDVADEAARRGAEPVAGKRALETLREFAGLVAGSPHAPAIRWSTVAGDMGHDALAAAGFTTVEVIHAPAGRPSAEDTRAATRKFLAAGVDLILFCGGDGTARDICAIAGEATPVLGIPAGVKMYSGVFGVTPVRTAQILTRHVAGEIGLATVEVVDLDEEKYRRDQWTVRLYMSARTPFEPAYVQAAKFIIAGADEEAAQQDIAAHLCEEIEAQPDTLFLLGPGSTLQAVGRALHLDKTLLGIDAVVHGGVAGKDLDERAILGLLARHPACKLVLSPIGAGLRARPRQSAAQSRRHRPDRRRQSHGDGNAREARAHAVAAVRHRRFRARCRIDLPQVLFRHRRLPSLSLGEGNGLTWAGPATEPAPGFPDSERSR